MADTPAPTLRDTTPDYARNPIPTSMGLYAIGALAAGVGAPICLAVYVGKREGIGWGIGAFIVGSMVANVVLYEVTRSIYGNTFEEYQRPQRDPRRGYR